LADLVLPDCSLTAIIPIASPVLIFIIPPGKAEHDDSDLTFPDSLNLSKPYGFTRERAVTPRWQQRRTPRRAPRRNSNLYSRRLLFAGFSYLTGNAQAVQGFEQRPGMLLISPVEFLPGSKLSVILAVRIQHLESPLGEMI
jgi:hypothetical protein